MRVHVIGGVDDLARDLERIAVRAPSDMLKIVTRGARVGASVARDLTKKSGGSHAGVSRKTRKVQPLVKSITSEVTSPGLFGLMAAEYGPDDSMPQAGIMRILERGTRNNPAKRIMARSADLMGPAVHGEVRDQVKEYFW